MKSAIFRRGLALVSAVFLLMTSVITVTAVEYPEARAQRTPRVVVSGNNYSGQIRFVSGVTYVGLREFSERLGARVTWDQTLATAGAKTTSLELSARIGDTYVTANGKRLSSSGRVFIEAGRTYVPLRAIGSAFGFETSWNSTSLLSAVNATSVSIISAPILSAASKEGIVFLTKAPQNTPL